MQIVIIVAVRIPPLPAAFLHGTKGNLAQPPQLAQQRRLFLPVALPKIDGLTIARFSQTLGLRQFSLQRGSVFRAGNGALGFKDARQSLAKTYHVLTTLLGHLTR